MSIPNPAVAAVPAGSQAHRSASARFVVELSFRDIYLLGQWPDADFGNSLEPHDISSACSECGRNRFAPGGCHGDSDE